MKHRKLILVTSSTLALLLATNVYAGVGTGSAPVTSPVSTVDTSNLPGGDTADSADNSPDLQAAARRGGGGRGRGRGNGNGNGNGGNGNGNGKGGGGSGKVGRWVCTPGFAPKGTIEKSTIAKGIPSDVAKCNVKCTADSGKLGGNGKSVKLTHSGVCREPINGLATCLTLKTKEQMQLNSPGIYNSNYISADKFANQNCGMEGWNWQ
jgi:hypothetical protein